MYVSGVRTPLSLGSFLGTPLHGLGLRLFLIQPLSLGVLTWMGAWLARCCHLVEGKGSTAQEVALHGRCRHQKAA